MTNPLLQSETATAAPAGRDHRASFVKLLHDQILKLNQAELDFGLYRILNRRRTEIHKYLNESLPAILQKATSGAVEKQSRALETAVRDLAEKLNNGAISNGYEEGAFEDGELVMERVLGPNVAKYQEAKQQLDHLQAQQTLSGSELDQLYLHLLTFFSRYYQGGDFLTVPRRGRARYLAPYSGEDTLFHWRSKGSHYVKTSTELRTYTYHPVAPAAGQPTTVRFELIEADTEQNNVKGDRRYFVPLPEQARHENDSFILPFSYRPMTEKEKAKYISKAKGRKATEETDEGEEAELSGNAQQRLLQDMLGSASLDEVDAPELLKQANRYAKKNTSDYFVHPNLGPFLKGELDSYLLTEYLQPETLQTPEVMQDRFAKYRAMREAGGGLIDFLHQLEDFQAQLFEKRKFVLRADYLMPIRLVPEALWPTLLGSAAQLDAWRDLFTLDLTGKAEAEQVQALREHPTLVVDTQHYDETTKYGLLAEYEDIESSLDGVLVHSENYAGLRTLENLYFNRVKMSYIDPPYNKDGDGFLYKDEFSKDSTWCSMLEERLLVAKNYLSDYGVIYSSIDKNEQIQLANVMSNVFGIENKLEELIWVQNSTDNRAKTYSSNHEYIETYAKNKKLIELSGNGFTEPKPGYLELNDLLKNLNSRYPKIYEVEEEIGKLYESYKQEFYESMENLGITNKSEIDKLDPWRGIYLYKFAEYRSSDGDLVSESDAEKLAATLLAWRESDPSAPSNKQSRTTKDPNHPNYRFYSPINPRNGLSYPPPKRGWSFPYDEIGDRVSFKEYDSQDRIVYRDNEKVPQYKRFVNDVERNVAKSVISDFSNGEQDLGKFFGVTNVFPNPKPVSLIYNLSEHATTSGSILMDFYVGSGTSIEAAIKKSYAGSKLRFLAFEMGEYFDSVTAIRMARSIFTLDWKDGQPNPMPHFNSLLGDLPDWVGRSPRLVQVLRLESFEDSLDALELPHERTEREKSMANLFGDEYLVKYMLGDLTDGQTVTVATEQFKNPWAYHLRAGQTVDLPETFNLLLGLKVTQVRELHHAARRYLLVRGEQHPTGERVLVVWRDVTTDFDPEAEKTWLSAELGALGWSWEEFQQIFINSDAVIPNAKCLSGEFKRRMMVRDEAFRALTAGGRA